MTMRQLAISGFMAIALLNVPSKATATWIEASCRSGAYVIGGIAPAPTTWCSMQWGPSGAILATEFSLSATFEALAVPGATASGTRWDYNALASGTLGPIVLTCSTITSAIDAKATAVGYQYHPHLGYFAVMVDIATYLGSIVPNNPPVSGCIPVL